MAALTPWQEVADRVFVRRYDPFDVNVTVVAGSRATLIVDTRTSLFEASQVRDDLRELSVPAPTAVVLTHAHLDHCLGAGAFSGLPLWASHGCREDLRRHGVAQRENLLEHLPEQEHAHLRASPIPVPDHIVTDSHRLDLGDRTLELLVLGRGHTDHDLVVHLFDADVVLAGDLVEVGAPPQFHDAFPFEWPGTLARVEALGATVTVPGHGAPADRPTVATQREELSHLAALCREVLAGARSRDSALASSPFPHATTALALERAVATGDGA